MNYERFLSSSAVRSRPDPISLTMTHEDDPSAMRRVSFANGAPCSYTFPVDRVCCRVQVQPSIGSVTGPANQDVEFSESETFAALQYGPARGLPELVAVLERLLTRFHGPPNPVVGRSLCVIPGAQDTLERLFRLFLDAGDTVLVSCPCYPVALAALMPIGVNLVGVDQDNEGIDVDQLRSLAKKYSKRGGDGTLKLLYLSKASSVWLAGCSFLHAGCPTFDNPTGVVVSEQRRMTILQIADECDFLLVEDDPYYLLGFDGRRPRSFLSVDTSGRVVRVDSFSKVVAPGLRIGCLSGPPAVVDLLVTIIGFSATQVCGISQMLLYKILHDCSSNEDKFDLFEERCRQVAGENEKLLNAMETAIEKYMPGKVSYTRPTGGMFLWAKLTDGEHADTKRLARRLAERGVQVLAGSCFYVDHESRASPALRLCFTAAGPDDIDYGCRMMGQLLSSTD